MLALIYLCIAVALGDQICRRFWFILSPAHRWASAFLVGILISTWLTYLFGLAFAAAAKPLIWANLSYFIITSFAVFKLGRRSNLNRHPSSVTKLEGRDAVFILAFVTIACWLMYGTLTMHDGDVRLTSVLWNDFGPNLALMQSFALGHNFPTEYPYFIGEPIRYHFLFWFQAGNLEFLGLNLAWALNLLSVLSMLALLISIMTLSEALFGSRLIGAIAALLIFFQGSLSYVPFFRSQHSVADAISAIIHLGHWLPSGYPYKGEDWGIWSISILYVQRHLLGAIGILCLVLTFLVDSCKERFCVRDHSERRRSSHASKESLIKSEVVDKNLHVPSWKSFIFCGVLVGLLPLWNSPIFVSALVVIGCLLAFLPNRARIGTLLAVAVLIGLPQVLFLRAAQTAQKFSFLHWGYTIDNPTLPRVLSYLLFTFGPKLALGFVALVLLTKSYRLFFLAVSSMIVLAFGTQLSVDIMNNQKFLYLWLMLLNLFVAHALWRIYQIRWVGRAAAIILAAIIVTSGLIEMFRVHNDTWVDVPFRDNSLSNWLLQNTKPTDVFLTDRFVHHPILMDGRRIFYGWPYFAWSMGYPTGERDAIYKRMFEEQNADDLVKLLKDNGINYVGIDNGLRQGGLGFRRQETLFATLFPKVFEDQEKHFGQLTIYKISR
jgi:hypothetical protein